MNRLSGSIVLLLRKMVSNIFYELFLIFQVILENCDLLFVSGNSFECKDAIRAKFLENTINFFGSILGDLYRIFLGFFLWVLLLRESGVYTPLELVSIKGM